MQTEVAVKFVFMNLVAEDPTILERFERSQRPRAPPRWIEAS